MIRIEIRHHTSDTHPEDRDAGNINITHDELPGNLFDFRSCEGVLSGNRDFGLFGIALSPDEWRVAQDSLGYFWRYTDGVTVDVDVRANTDSLDLRYTVTNETTSELRRVQIHPCLPTTAAPAFFAPADCYSEDSPDPTFYDRRIGGRRRCRSTHFSLFDRLYLWKDGIPFPYSSLQSAGEEVHLSLMKTGEEQVEWAWWNNDVQTFDIPFMALADRNQEFILAYGFSDSIWSSSNVGDERACFHLFPYFGDLAPGASRTVYGKLYLFRGDPVNALQRFQGDMKDIMGQS